MTGEVQTPWIDFSLYLITDRSQTCGRTLVEVIGDALRGGVRAVQLREKDMTSRAYYELAYELRKLTARYNARLFINDRIDITLAVDADGVHLGEESIPIHRARKILGERKLIGVSCHNQVSAITAQAKGADFITFGPVYHTLSKAPYGQPLGVGKLEEVSRILQIPVFALGGINRDNTHEVIAAGAFGVALVSAVIAADNPREETQKLLSLIPSHDDHQD